MHLRGLRKLRITFLHENSRYFRKLSDFLSHHKRIEVCAYYRSKMVLKNLAAKSSKMEVKY